MSIIQGTSKTGQISRKEFVSISFKVSGSTIVENSWTQIEIPSTPAEGVIKRVRALKLSGSGTELDFFVSEDNTMQTQDIVVKYENINLISNHLDSEESLYYNLNIRDETNYSLGSMFVYLKTDSLQNNIWYRLDIVEVG